MFLPKFNFFFNLVNIFPKIRPLFKIFQNLKLKLTHIFVSHIFLNSFLVHHKYYVKMFVKYFSRSFFITFMSSLILYPSCVTVESPPHSRNLVFAYLTKFFKDFSKTSKNISSKI